MQINDILIKDIPKKRRHISKLRDNLYEIKVKIFFKELFSFKSRSLKMLSLKVTDNTDSILVKMFLRKNDDIYYEINEGDYVRIVGHIIYDQFYNDIIFQALHIEALDEIIELEPKDDEDVKRVELHAYTKMSALDGLNTASEYVKIADKLGFNAIAITDFNSVEALPELFQRTNFNITPIFGIELSYIDDSLGDDWELQPPRKIVILAQNKTGLKNMYSIFSDASTIHYQERPLTLKSVIESFRKGILIGNSFISREIDKYSDEEAKSLLSFFDYIEVLPPKAYLYTEGVEDNIRRIIALSKEMNKLVVAVSGCHYIRKDYNRYYEVLTNKKQPMLHLRTTNEMLEEFSFLPKEEAYEIVVSNTNKIANQIHRFNLIDNSLLVPKDDELKNSILNIPSIKEELKRLVISNLKELYGDNPNNIITDRLDYELKLILNNNNEFIYYISHILVNKSMSEGYIVGNRGMVSTSFVARLLNITNINPLPAHYRCNKCKYHVFDDDSYIGFDMPEAICPICGNKLINDGHNLPVEPFIGLNGEKIIDIDFNFSGEYQATIHNYLKQILGEDKVYKCGTTSMLSYKNAYGYTYSYFEAKNEEVRDIEKERIANYFINIKRSNGVHPGGIIIVPKGVDINEITPVQYPSYNLDNSWKITHIPHFTFGNSLIKLDILGHDDPTVIKYLMDYVHKHPQEFPFDNAKDIPINDKNLMKLFNSTDIIGLTKSELGYDNAMLGIPEFSSSFVRNLVDKVKPQDFSDLVKISGLAHGTNVWNNNGELLFNGSTKFERIPLKRLIAFREDIMQYLISKGIDKDTAYEIMEFIRKGTIVRQPDVWNEYKEIMKKHFVPEWYIWSCEQILYLFPRSHATSYILMALRMAWFKLYAPKVFYSAWFTYRCRTYDEKTMLAGVDAMRNKIAEIKSSEESAMIFDSLILSLEVAIEATLRGIKFLPFDYNKSTNVFEIEDEGIRFPNKNLSKKGD